MGNLLTKEVDTELLKQLNDFFAWVFRREARWQIQTNFPEEKFFLKILQNIKIVPEQAIRKLEDMKRHYTSGSDGLQFRITEEAANERAKL